MARDREGVRRDWLGLGGVDLRVAVGPWGRPVEANDKLPQGEQGWCSEIEAPIRTLSFFHLFERRICGCLLGFSFWSEKGKFFPKVCQLSIVEKHVNRGTENAPLRQLAECLGKDVVVNVGTEKKFLLCTVVKASREIIFFFFLFLPLELSDSVLRKTQWLLVHQKTVTLCCSLIRGYFFEESRSTADPEVTTWRLLVDGSVHTVKLGEWIDNEYPSCLAAFCRVIRASGNVPQKSLRGAGSAFLIWLIRGADQWPVQSPSGRQQGSSTCILSASREAQLNGLHGIWVLQDPRLAVRVDPARASVWGWPLGASQTLWSPSLGG